jgi:5-methylcytosine-specific restriction endonuclease McrA
MNLGMSATDWEVRIRDECTCRYCDLCGLDNFDIWMQLGIDHIIPRISGGDESAENKAVACSECNCLKHKYVPDGSNREERIADARRYVQMMRDPWQEQFHAIVKAIQNRN